MKTTPDQLAAAHIPVAVLLLVITFVPFVTQLPLLALVPVYLGLFETVIHEIEKNGLIRLGRQKNIGYSQENDGVVLSMIYIIRHGQTEMNSRQALQGRSDYALNEVGRSQALEAAEKLKDVAFDRVYASPLVRAVQTAQLVVPGIQPVIDERLIEMDYGPYEGTDLTRLPPEILTFFSDFVHNPAPEGMEPLRSVVSRAGAFLEDIRNIEGNILISTHAIAMKGLLEYLTPDAGGAYWSKYIGNCAIYTAKNQGGRYSVPTELV